MKRIEPFSFFVPTRIEYGAGKASQLSDEVKKLNSKRPIIVTGKTTVKSELVNKIKEQFKANNIKLDIFSEVESNPRDTTVNKLADLAKQQGNDLMIAVGGGSSMDTAKCAGMLVTNGRGIHDYIEDYELKDIKKQALPLITIPTTAGTGSEISFWAVVTDTREAKHMKRCVGSKLICPTVALVDPLATVSMPPRLTAYTGLDALSHAIEGYVCLVAEPITDALALSAIKLIADNLTAAVANGDNIEARDHMLLGNLMAGIVVGNADCGVIHCLGHAIGGLYDVHHGLAMGIFFPYGMEYNLVACPEKFVDIAKAMGENVSELSLMEAARKSIEAVVNLLRMLRIPTLKGVGAKVQDFKKLAEMAMADLTCEANPRKMTVEDMEEILKDAYQDKFRIAGDSYKGRSLG
jgi:alcohol dehydrogenase class IV